MKHPISADNLQNALTPALQDGEAIRWSEQADPSNQYVNIGACALATLIFFGAYFGFMHGITGDGDNDFITKLVLSFFLVAGSASLLTTLYSIASLGGTLYAVSNRRILILNRRPLGKPLIYALPLAVNSVCRIKQHSNGCRDYLMYEEDLGRYSRTNGLRRIRNTQGLETALRDGGVQLPDTTAQQAAPTFRLSWEHSLPGTRIALLLIGLYLSAGIFLPAFVIRTGANLYLSGERSSATIIGYEKRSVEEDKRTVTRYYPILLFPTADSPLVRATDMFGDTKPEWNIGEQTEVLYAPGNPSRVMRDTGENRSNAIGFIGVFVAISLWLLWRLLRTIRQWYGRRSEAYYLVELTKI